jgi:hypothetical protein
VPADDKPYLRMVTADLVVRTLEALPLGYPRVGDRELARFQEMRAVLEGDG